MAKERVIKPMTEEQRRRILATPGVVIHRREKPPEDPFYTPRLRARTTLSITASELIDDESDED